MTKFAYQGDTVSLVDFDTNAIQPKLHPAVYSVGLGMAGFYLKVRGARLKTPDTLYGSVLDRAEKVLNSYKDTNSSFGVLLSGAKGAGKTMLSNVVANRAIEELGLPVVMVEGHFPTNALCSFIEKLGECVVYFDEFGKRFKDGEADQDDMLTLFDGSGASKRMVLLTENSKYDVNQYMINRPGRIWYHFQYDKLEVEVIEEYCKAQGIDEETITKILLRREIVREFSFDVLQALVVEFKRYGGDIDELAQDLNVEAMRKPSEASMTVVDVVDAETGKDIPFVEDNYKFPSADRGQALYLRDDPEVEKDIEESEGSFNISMAKGERDYVYLKTKHLVSAEGNMYVFRVKRQTGEGTVLVKALKETSSSGGYGVY